MLDMDDGLIPCLPVRDVGEGSVVEDVAVLIDLNEGRPSMFVRCLKDGALLLDDAHRGEELGRIHSLRRRALEGRASAIGRCLDGVPG